MAATLQQVVDAVTAIGTSLVGITGDIQALKDQIAAGSPVSQADLDNLLTQVQNVATQAQDLDMQTP